MILTITLNPLLERRIAYNTLKIGAVNRDGNIDEIEKSLNIKLQNDEDKINFLASLYTKNIKQAYLTDDCKPFFASNFDYHFKIISPSVKTIDSSGSGDAFTAGIA